jgi:hypothetical protein
MKINSTRNRPVVVHRADVISPLQWMYWRYQVIRKLCPIG